MRKKILFQNCIIIVLFFAPFFTVNAQVESEKVLSDTEADFGCVECLFDDINFELTFEENIPLRRDNSQFFDNKDYQIVNNEFVSKNPIAYVSGEVFKVSLEISTYCFLRRRVRIRGVDQEGIFNFEEKQVTISREEGKTKSVIEYEATASNNIASNKVDFFDLIIDWQYQKEDESWVSLAESNNLVYVTFAESLVDDSYNLQSIFHLGTKFAKDKTTKAEIVEEIWEGFKSEELTTYNEVPLHYYNSWINSCTTLPEALTTTNVFGKLDAQCNVFSILFLGTLKRIGVEGEAKTVAVRSDLEFVLVPLLPIPAEMLVKNWVFEQPSNLHSIDLSISPASQGFDKINITETGVGSLPFVENQTGDGHEYSFLYSEVKDQPGKEGQGTSNPLADFDWHQISKFDNLYYDPSYKNDDPIVDDGNFESNYEDSSIYGYYIPMTWNITEEQIEVDIDEDGEIENTLEMVRVWFIKENIEGLKEIKVELGDF